MPTIVGMRRRGYPPEAIRDFCERIGIAKREYVVDVALLEHAVREHLNRHAPRALAVLRPLRLIIENYPDGQNEEIEIANNPEDAEAGTRRVPFSGELFIEQDDFRETPPPKYFRLSPGCEVRLRGTYLITCVGIDKDAATGEITAVRCTYDPATRSGSAPDGRKVKATIHWVSAAHARDAEIRLYDRLFRSEMPGAGGRDFLADLNPGSLDILSGKVEPALAGAAPGSRWQFERLGYFAVDPDATGARLVFNRTVALRDTWAKIQGRG
jgi:glutaminyl-tRNA synthetase